MAGIVVDVKERHLGALVAQAAGDRLSDAGCSTSNDCNFALDVHSFALTNEYIDLHEFQYNATHPAPFFRQVKIV